MKNLLAADVPPINNPVLPGIAKKAPEEAPVLFGKFIAGLVGVMLVVATLLALAQLLQGGIEWITGGGEKGNLENARNRIMNALIGLVLIFGVWAFYAVILRFLGVSLVGSDGIININLPSLTQ